MNEHCYLHNHYHENCEACRRIRAQAYVNTTIMDDTVYQQADTPNFSAIDSAGQQSDTAAQADTSSSSDSSFTFDGGDSGGGGSSGDF